MSARVAPAAGREIPSTRRGDFLEDGLRDPNERRAARTTGDRGCPSREVRLAPDSYSWRRLTVESGSDGRCRVSRSLVSGQSLRPGRPLPLLLGSPGCFDQAQCRLAHEDRRMKAPAPRERRHIAILVSRSVSVLRVAGMKLFP